jgi:prepilin-type N-terminal cleavage/methylation domain-containing protein
MFRIRKNQKGFTLIELAIVLVIIGIIIGAVMKGRDIMRSAQTKAFWQGFAGKWITMVDNYYDKTGQNLADGERNGGTTGGLPNGFMDGIYMGGTLTRALARDTLMKAGINACDLIKTSLVNDTTTCPVTGTEIGGGQVDSEVYGKVSNIRVGFSNYVMSTGGAIIPNTRKNFVVFLYVPIDIAKALDTIVDGVSAGNSGRMINFGCGAVTGPDDATTFDLANAVAVGGTITLSTTAGTAAGNDWPATADTNNYKCSLGYMLEH